MFLVNFLFNFGEYDQFPNAKELAGSA